MQIIKQVFKQPTKIAPNFAHQETHSKIVEDSTRTSQYFVLSEALSSRRYLKSCSFIMEITVIFKESATSPQDLHTLLFVITIDLGCQCQTVVPNVGSFPDARHQFTHQGEVFSFFILVCAK